VSPTDRRPTPLAKRINKIQGAEMLRLAVFVLVPCSLILGYVVRPGPIPVFTTAIFSIAALAEYVRRATEDLAELSGPGVGGLIAVTLGNIAEVILAVFVLMRGANDVVKGQIIGAILGNGLLALGLAIVVGSWGREKVTFHRRRAGLLSGLLILAMIALSVPALFEYSEQGNVPAERVVRISESLSIVVAAILILVYLGALFYTLYTHRDVFATARKPGILRWPGWLAGTILAGATIAISLESELVSRVIEPTAAKLGISTFFFGLVVLAIVANTADYFAALTFARRGEMGLVLSFTIGSSIQVALVMAPLLVFISLLIGHPMTLVFRNPMEIVAVAAAAFIVNTIARNGEATWFEGVMLLSVYAILGTAFFFLTV
jgi:Ca2+:H+ antiporter